MSKARRKSAPPVSAGRTSSAWTWVAVAAVAGIAALIINVMRSTTPAPTSASVATPAVPRFLPTVELKTPPPGTAPEGMVWIPGGEFSMGAQDPPDMNDAVGMQATTDSRPIHRVYVDGFWMDATEVTNEQFAAFVEGDGLRDGGRADAARGGFPGAPPENLVAARWSSRRPTIPCRSTTTFNGGRT